ncbi:MAG: hypothetical protein WAN47_03120 [Nitrosotalea sp.]
MALDSVERGTLEKLIDRTVESIPSWIKEIREIKKELQIKEEGDYALGFAWGHIYTDFRNYLVNMRGKNFDDELAEFGAILNKRTKEMKEAIFRSG